MKHFRLDAFSGDGWAAEFSTDQWLGIDFKRNKMVKAIVTRAARINGDFVSSYRLLYSNELDGEFASVEKVFHL